MKKREFCLYREIEFLILVTKELKRKGFEIRAVVNDETTPEKRRGKILSTEIRNLRYPITIPRAGGSPVTTGVSSYTFVVVYVL